MAKKSCVYTPSKGVEVYRKLTKTLGHNLGTRAFLLAIHPEFKATFKNSLSLTAEGVPTFDSIMNNRIVQSMLDEEDMINFLKTEINQTEFPKTEEGYSNALRQAQIFNNQSEMRKSLIVYPKETTEGYILKIEKRDDESLKKYSEQQQAKNLENSLISIVNSLPISHDIVKSLTTEDRTIEGMKSLSKFLIELKEAFEQDKPIATRKLGILVEMLKDDRLISRAIHYMKSLDDSSVIKILQNNGIEVTTLSENDIYTAVGSEIFDALDMESSPLFSRAANRISELLNTYNIEDITNAVDKAEVDNETFISEVFETTNNEEIDSFTSESLEVLDTEIDNFKKLIEELKITEVKRINLTNGSLDGLYALSNESIIDTIQSYLTYAYDNLSSILNDLNDLNSKSFQDRCKITREALDYSRGLAIIIAKLSSIIETEGFLKESISENTYNTIRSAIDNFNVVNGKVVDRALSLGEKYFTELLRPIIGDKIEIKVGDRAGETITLEELIHKADRDISVISRLLDSAANSNDVILQAAHLAIKKEKDKARLNTISISKRIAAMGLKAEQAGITDFTFMYEKDTFGNRTTDYISEVNRGGYKAAYDAFRESLEKKYGKTDSDSIKKAKDRDIAAWHKENSTLTGDGYKPKYSKWKSKEFANLSPAQKEFYQEFMEIKESLDMKIPDTDTYLTNSIKIRKDTWNRIKTSGSMTGLFNAIKKSVEDTFINRSDDSEYGKANTDLSGNVLRTPPVYFINMGENESTEDLTDDLVGALMAYAYMANNYQAMTNVADALELGRDVIAKREVSQTSGDKKLYERVKNLGVDASVPIPKSKTEAEKLYDTLLESQVYGIYMKDEGNLDKVSKSKFANFMLRVGSNVQLGLNFLAGVSSAVNGLAMQNIEAAAGEFFDRKELAGADKYMMKHIAAQAAEVGQRVKTNRLDLIFELFNVKQDYDKDIRNKKFDRKNFIVRVFGPSVLYLYQTLGDQFLYGRAALAILDREKVIKDGKKMSLRDALEEVPIDKNNKKLGVELSFKGLKRADGADFTINDIHRISRKIERINQYCFGVYNTEDINAAKRTIAGRFLLQYRDWMRPAWNRRFARAHHDVLLNIDREGYYITGIRFTKQLLKDIRNGELHIMQNYNKLTKEEQANIRRASFEICQYGSLVALVALLDALRWDDMDPDEKSWAESMLEYTLRRQLTELGAVIPGPTMFTEGFKILKSPVANVDVLESTVDIFKLLWPPNYADELSAGPYKGHSTAYKTFFNSPFGLQTKNIRRMINPEEAISWLKQ